MSLHSSLKSPSGLARKRNVLRRTERLAKLAELGRWHEGKDSVYGLPKTLAGGPKKLRKKKDEEEEEKAEEATAEEEKKA